MAGAPPRHHDSPPALPDELIEEILLRLPPDEPAWLLRASLISKDWGRTISGPAFRRRLHEFHRTPPVLGFLHNWDDERIPRFHPTTASSLSLAAPDSETWRALDCRHGRALFISEEQCAQELLVWEPITGARRHLPVPPLFEAARALRNTLYGSVNGMYPGAAVFCAADGCDHRDCHGDPFRLVFLFTDENEENEEDFEVWLFVFSSETDTWDRLTPMHSNVFMDFACYSSVLVGRSLLYFMAYHEGILQYDLATHRMTVLLLPPGYRSGYMGRFNIMLTEDGGLGVTEYLNQNLKLWTWEATDGTDSHWVLSRVINLVNLLPTGALLDADSRVEVVGFVEGTNTIFLNMVAGIFIVELQSEKARRICDTHGSCNLIPVVTFYTPMPRGDSPPSGSSEEAGGDERAEVEKVVEQTQHLFDKASSAIEEGAIIDARFSHAFKTRVPSHREVALECASTEYGCKSQAMNDSLDDVPKRASDEESVTGTSSKDDAGNSKTSGSNFKDAAPPSYKVLRR